MPIHDLKYSLMLEAYQSSDFSDTWGNSLLCLREIMGFSWLERIVTDKKL